MDKIRSENFEAGLDLTPQVKRADELEELLPSIVSCDASIDSIEGLTSTVQGCYQPNKQFFGDDVEGIKVRILYTREEMDEALGYKTQDWVVGSAGKQKTIVIFSPTVFPHVSPHPTSDFLPVLTHEITHVFTEELFRLKYPRWLSEGLSGYVAGQYKTRASNIQVIQDFSEIHDRDGWNKTNPYNQAYSFTAYLIERFGKEGLLSLLRSLSPNDYLQDFTSKFEDAYKCDFDKCNTDWANSLKTIKTKTA